MDTNAWLPSDGRFFNPDPVLRAVPLTGGAQCIVVDDALMQPERLAAWAATQRFEPPQGYPYPGQVAAVPAALTQRVADFFALHVRKALGARRTLDLTVRLSMVTTPPHRLEPRQWQCHRDRVADDPAVVLFAASVLYLFRDRVLGGTSFYVPRRSALETDRMLADSQLLDAHEFNARHGVQPGYMTGSNAWFERVAQVPAAWNRMVFYDGGLFHSADVDDPGLLSADQTRGRLTLNSFFTCRRQAA
ncbi:MAG: hypothetical protein IPF94_04205 [Betaproteobacteria bacterium]|nr:hypothetical protein [Betaproteobacteria bacterium]